MLVSTKPARAETSLEFKTVALGDSSLSGLPVGVGLGVAGFGHGYMQKETLHDTQEKSLLSEVHGPLLYHHDYTEALL